MSTRVRSVAALTLALVAGGASAAPAIAAPPASPPITVIAEGLDDPYGLSFANGKLYTAESASGEITGVIPGGGPSVRVDGFTAPAGVDRTATELFTVTGETGEPGGSTIYVSAPGVSPRPLADLLVYELAENPDGQQQFDDDNQPLDALSNPFSVLGGRGGDEKYAYVADAGANAVLAVDRDGTVSTFYVPPVVTTGSCEGQENNDAEHEGCDSVPTGLAFGPDGALYVSALTAEAPGQGRVYVLDASSGELLRTIKGLDGPTGVAVGDDGAVYVSELLENSPPPGPPPAGFDISSVGRIVRVDTDGERSIAQVTMPVGLRWANGALHSTAWSVAGAFLQQPGLGQIVRVDESAFTAED